MMIKKKDLGLSAFAFNTYEVARKGIMEGQIQGTLWRAVMAVQH